MRKLLVAAALLLGACHAKLGGDLQVDDAAFAATGCRSGEALGFSGIEVTDAEGRRLRLIANADGTTDVALFAKDAAKGDSLGNCGTLVAHAQSSRINNITNLEGTASLSCEAVGHKVSGQVTFENCH